MTATPGHRRAQHGEQFEPVQIGQREVEQHQVGAVLDGRPQPGHGGRRRAGRMVRLAEGLQQPQAGVDVIFDD